MAAYEAIRDSFREFNRTLIDSQAWNAQHEVSMADRQLKQTMLLNQLNQQKFSNRMAEERIGLLQAGNKQGADRLEEQIRNNDLINNRTTARDTNNYNYQQAMLTKTAAKNKMDSNYQQAVLKGQTETRIEAKETADLKQQQLTLQNEDLERTAAVAKASLVPSRVILPPSVTNNPKVFDIVKDEALTRWGASFDGDNVLIGRDGNEKLIPKHEQFKLNFKVKALEATYDNTPKLVSDELAVMTRSKSKLDATIGSKKSIYDKNETAMMKRQSNLLAAGIKDKTNYLNRLDTVEGQVKYLTDQAKNIEIAAANLSSPKKGDDANGAAAFITEAAAMRAQAKALLLTKGGGTTGTGLITKVVYGQDGKPKGMVSFDKANQRYGRGGKWYNSLEDIPGNLTLKEDGDTPDKTLVTRVEKLFKSAIAPSDSMFDTLSGDTKNAISTLKNLVKTNADERGIDLSTESSYDMLIGEQKAMMIEAHNKLATMYQEKQGTSSDNEFNAWVKETYRPKLRNLGFEYDPKTDYREQIGQSD